MINSATFLDVKTCYYQFFTNVIITTFTRFNSEFGKDGGRRSAIPICPKKKKKFLTPQNFNFQLLRVNRGDWQQSYTVISSYIYTGRSDKRKLDNLQLCLLKFSALLKHNACFYSLSQFRLLYYLFWKQSTPHICLNSFIS